MKNELKEIAWPLLKSVWPWLLLASIVWTAVVMIVVYGLYFFIPLAAAGVVLELLLWLMAARKLSQKTLRSIWRPVWRHGWRIVGSIAGGTLASLPLCLIVGLPAIILTLAQWEASHGIEIGDPVTLPSYFIYMAAVVWLLTFLIHVSLRLLFIYSVYYLMTKKHEKNSLYRS
jgi:hypothetical protein